MNTYKMMAVLVLLMAGSTWGASAQQNSKPSENAALRYWAAFAEMQDSSITDDQAKELNLILEGTAPYDDLKYKDLVEKNRPAIEVMSRGTALPTCDWGMDYGLGDQTSVEYARKALTLGRLNVLYAFHLMIAGDKDGAVRTLAAGVRFSHDIENGGTLFATLVAKDLLVDHFRAIEGLSHLAGFSPGQRSELQKAVAQLGSSGLDWQSAMKRELGVLNKPDWQLPLRRVTQGYMAALNDTSALPNLESSLANAPSELQRAIPNPKRVLEEKQDFTRQLQQVRLLLQ